MSQYTVWANRPDTVTSPKEGDVFTYLEGRGGSYLYVNGAWKNFDDIKADKKLEVKVAPTPEKVEEPAPVAEEKPVKKTTTKKTTAKKTTTKKSE